MAYEVPRFTNPDDIRTYLQYDFYPDDFLSAKKIDINSDAVKGAVTRVTWLPKSGIFHARATIAPVKLHPVLNTLSGHNAMGVPMPNGLSHTRMGIFSTSSLRSVGDETLAVAEVSNPDKAEGADVTTTLFMNALARRLMDATVDATAKYVSGEFDPEIPTTSVDSRGPISLSPDSYSIKEVYQAPKSQNGQ